MSKKAAVDDWGTATAKGSELRELTCWHCLTLLDMGMLHAGYIFLIPSQEWTETWILAGHLYLIWGYLGVFRDSSREPVSPVGTYRSASHPDENLRWSMPRSAVSTDVFGCVAALCMGTIWDYDTPWTGIHLQAAICFISRFSNRFNWHFSDVSKVFCLARSLGTEYAGLGAGFNHVSFGMFHSGVGKTECKPSDTTGLWWYGDMKNVDIMG